MNIACTATTQTYVTDQRREDFSKYRSAPLDVESVRSRRDSLERTGKLVRECISHLFHNLIAARIKVNIAPQYKLISIN